MESNESNFRYNDAGYKKHKLHGVNFFIFIVFIELCWLLGTKISEMLLNLMIADGLQFDQIQVSEQFYSYTVAATVLFWGLLIDRKPKLRKIILILSNLIWIAGSFSLFFIKVNYMPYTFIQIIWGISFGANGPLLGSYLGDLFKINRRGLLFSTFTIFVYIIKASSIGVTGIMGNMLGNWKEPTFIFAILGLIVIILFIFAGNEPKLASVEPEFIDKIEKGYIYNRKITWDGVKTVLKNRTNILFLAQGISGMIGVVVVTRYMNYWFTSDMGMNMNSFVASIILGGGAAIGAILGIVLVGKWIDKQFEKGKLNKSLYFAIVCLFFEVLFYFILTRMLVYPTTINPSYDNLGDIFRYYPIFYSFIIVFNICSFVGTPIGTTVDVARTHVNIPEHRGTAGALYNLFNFIGSGIALAVGVILFTYSGSYQKTIFLGSTFWFISLAIWIFISMNIRNDYSKVKSISGAFVRFVMRTMQKNHQHDRSC